MVGPMVRDDVRGQQRAHPRERRQRLRRYVLLLQATAHLRSDRAQNRQAHVVGRAADQRVVELLRGRGEQRVLQPAHRHYPVHRQAQCARSVCHGDGLSNAALVFTYTLWLPTRHHPATFSSFAACKFSPGRISRLSRIQNSLKR